MTKRKLRLFHQDEARFGRLPVIERAWSPSGVRPMVKGAVVREYRYTYGAVDVLNGDIFCLSYDMMNTGNMEDFLARLQAEFKDDYIVLVADGASSHTTEKLNLPEHMYMQVLPPYCPELNPVEQLWRYLRSHACGNRYYGTLQDVTDSVSLEIRKLAGDREKVRQMFYWHTIAEAVEAARKMLAEASKAS
ncbi:MAG: IS630 family transposase [Victivallales bacterium]|nr:IS630 family transposase [Victivallales bacterium]